MCACFVTATPKHRFRNLFWCVCSRTTCKDLFGAIVLLSETRSTVSNMFCTFLVHIHQRTVSERVFVCICCSIIFKKLFGAGLGVFFLISSCNITYIYFFCPSVVPNHMKICIMRMPSACGHTISWCHSTGPSQPPSSGRQVSCSSLLLMMTTCGTTFLEIFRPGPDSCTCSLSTHVLGSASWHQRWILQVLAWCWHMQKPSPTH